MKKYILFLGLSCLISCKSPTYIPQPKSFKHHVKGLFLKVKLVDESKRVYGKTLGEIIEITPNEILVLTVDEKKIITIAKNDISKAEIVVASSSNNPEAISTAAGLVNLLAFYHGHLTVLSVPFNGMVTAIIGGDAAKGRYSIKYPEQVSWEDMKKFARFPQGIPKNINKNSIK